MSVQVKTFMVRLLGAAIALLPLFAHAQDGDALDGKLKQYQKQLDGSAVALVYKDGKITQKAQLGDLKPDVAVPVGAASKWLIAALVMTFVDEGKLSLDDKVSTYIPVMANYSKNYITIRQCLSHFTGIEDKDGGINVFKNKYANLQAEVTDFISKREIQTNPGTEFRYNEMGVDMAARVVEIVGKKPFDRLIKDRLFRVLDMKRSSYPAGEHMASPSYGAVCSANDYMNFMSMILNKGMYNGKKILSEASVAEILKSNTTPVLIKSAPKAADGFAYGLGVWLEQDETGTVTAAISPSMAGSWAYIDLAHGYAALFFAKELGKDPRRNIFNDIRQTLSE